MRIVCLFLIVVAVISMICGIGVHFGCRFLTTWGTAWGYLRFANTCLLLAIALAVGHLLKCPKAESATAEDAQEPSE